MPCSGVAKQRHETKVHVLLDIAMKQRQARLVGDHIHGGASKSHKISALNLIFILLENVCAFRPHSKRFRFENRWERLSSIRPS